MVALTEIDICKLALSRLRVAVTLTGSELADLDADASQAEEELLTWYALTLGEVMEKVSWRPATVDAALELVDQDDGEQPWTGKWVYRYRYPDDAADIRAVRVRGDGRKLARPRDFDISSDEEGRLVLANLTPLDVEYVQLPTVEVYGTQALFCKLLVLRLAWNVAPGLMISDATIQAVVRDYTIALAEASAKDANEAEPGDEQDGDFVLARRGG